MNINKIKRRWPVLSNDALAMIDRMNTWELFECGLITNEERDAIVDDFVCEITVALEAKGFVSADDLHLNPKSEIVKRFRRGLGQTKPDTGCE